MKGAQKLLLWFIKKKKKFTEILTPPVHKSKIMLSRIYHTYFKPSNVWIEKHATFKTYAIFRSDVFRKLVLKRRNVMNIILNYKQQTCLSG